MAQSTKNINKKQPHLVKEKHNHVFLFLFLALIIAAGVVYGILVFKPREPKSAEDNQASTSSTERQNDQKDDSNSTGNDKQTEENKDEIKPESEKNNPQYEGEDPNTYSALTGIINASVVDGNVSIRVAIDQSVSGTCVFTITTPSGQIIPGSGALEIGPSSSFCSFTTSFTESGTWKISVAATSSDKHGIITSEANL